MQRVTPSVKKLFSSNSSNSWKSSRSGRGTHPNRFSAKQDVRRLKSKVEEDSGFSAKLDVRRLKWSLSGKSQWKKTPLQLLLRQTGRSLTVEVSPSWVEEDETATAAASAPNWTIAGWVTVWSGPVEEWETGKGREKVKSVCLSTIGDSAAWLGLECELRLSARLEAGRDKKVYLYPQETWSVDLICLPELASGWRLIFLE